MSDFLEETHPVVFVNLSVCLRVCRRIQMKWSSFIFISWVPLRAKGSSCPSLDYAEPSALTTYQSESFQYNLNSALETFKLIFSFLFLCIYSFSLSICKIILLSRCVILFVSPRADMALCTVRLFSELLFKREEAIFSYFGSAHDG